MKLIALMGKAGAGKDTVGQFMLEHDRKGRQLAFADRIKDLCSDVFALPREVFSTEDAKNTPTDLPVLQCPNCKSIDCAEVNPHQAECRKCTAVGEHVAFRAFWTPRMILQHFGTEGVRRVDKDAWTRYTLKQATERHGDSPFVVITDCRYKSEMAAVQKAGGVVWRIRRPETDNHAHGLAEHVSESEADTIPDTEFSFIIINDGPLDVLKAKALEGLSRLLAP